MRRVTLSPRSTRNLRAFRAFCARIITEPRRIVELRPVGRDVERDERLESNELESLNESVERLIAPTKRGIRDARRKRRGSRSFKSRDQENSRNFGSRSKRG